MQWLKLSLKNRIYFSMLALVVLSLTVIGGATIYFFDKENSDYHLKRIQRKEKTVNSSLQYFLNDLKPIEVNDFITKEFDYKIHEISDVNSLKIIIYNLQGEVLINTEKNSYDSLKTKNQIAPKLLIKIKNNQEVFQRSKTGKINSYSYAKNKAGERMVIVNIPYDPMDYNPKSEVWEFLNDLLKIFSFLFIGAGFLAYFLSRYITKSIAEVSKKIKAVQINEINEKLHWNNEDEIGVLVNAYNEMINKLQVSTDKLAKNERQNAWREMAKQVAHEIKNPLTPMKLSIQHLRRVIDVKNERQNKILKEFESKMVQQVDLLSEIANEFSNFADLPKTKMEIINIETIIKKTIDLYQHNKQIKISIISNPEATFIINGDENQLTRVFTNLINNSIQAITDKGQIDILLQRKNTLISIEIKDDGNGIPINLQSHIFEPQFTTKTNGKGLGLAMVHQIILNHKGNIALISSEKKGTSFKINFPTINNE